MSEIEQNCSNYEYAIKTDIASYFESINHHPLINSLRSIGCPAEIVNLLESLLSLWREVKSYGIIQQNFASDVLGNFNLFAADYQLQIKGISSIRYVDDFYLFLHNKNEALLALADLTDIIRADGLSLNEAKTYIKHTNELIKEETESEEMINEIVRGTFEKSIVITPYGFEIPWFDDTKYQLPEEGDKDIIEELYSKHKTAQWQSEKIIKFCLLFLARYKSELAK